MIIENKKYLNKRCFVIGGGESIRELMNNGLYIPKLFHEEITIGTNKSYLLGESTYHIAMDFDYFSKDRENLLKQNLYVSDNIHHHEKKLSLIKRNRAKIISESIEEGLYYGKSTGYLAMNLAHVLGCNPIYLMGIDLVGLHFHEGYGANKNLQLPREHRIIENELRSGIKHLINLDVKVISLSECSRLNDIIPYDPSVLEIYGYDSIKKMKVSIGVNWKDNSIQDKLTLDNNHKYYKRQEWIDTTNKSYIDPLLPEYKECDSKDVLDFSAGNGVFLEIMRYYGHNIQGTDISTCRYIPFHKSQDIPMVYFDASNLPYPFADKSFDLVSCISSIVYYKVDWNLVLDEFFRIARETVIIVVNHGEIWESKRHFIDNYIPPDGWELSYQVRSTFKWVYREGK